MTDLPFPETRLALTPAAMDAIDMTELLEGYRDGRNNDPAPGANRSNSYCHGWWTGMHDGGHRDYHWTDRVIVQAYRDSRKRAA